MILVIKSDLLSQMMKTDAEIKINLYCYRYWKLIFPLCFMRELEGSLKIEQGVLWWSALCSLLLHLEHLKYLTVPAYFATASKNIQEALMSITRDLKVKHGYFCH